MVYNSTESILQVILYLSYDTFEEALFFLGGDISELPDLKNHLVTLYIVHRWGQRITEEGEIFFAWAEEGVREVATT